MWHFNASKLLTAHIQISHLQWERSRSERRALDADVRRPKEQKFVRDEEEKKKYERFAHMVDKNRLIYVCSACVERSRIRPENGKKW